jgi:hypothetical protein
MARSASRHQRQFSLFWLFVVTTALAFIFALSQTRFAPVAFLIGAPLPVAGYLGMIRWWYGQRDIRHQDRSRLGDLVLSAGLVSLVFSSVSVAFVALIVLAEKLLTR